MTKKKTVNVNKRWSKMDLDWLKANLDNFPYKEIANKLGRTESAIKARIITKGWAIPKPKWRAEEVRTLKNLFKKIPLDELTNKMGKTRNSILCKVRRLGI